MNGAFYNMSSQGTNLICKLYHIGDLDGIGLLLILLCIIGKLVAQSLAQPNLPLKKQSKNSFLAHFTPQTQNNAKSSDEKFRKFERKMMKCLLNMKQQWEG